jgi:hypothetical protein
MVGSGHISRSIQILTSRVYQVDHVLCDEGVNGLSWMVVNDGSVGSASTDCIETQAFIVLLLVSALINIEGSFVLIHLIKFRTPAPELGHCHSIS